MKIPKYIVFLLLIIIPLKVDARISLTCPGSTAPNKEVKCAVTSDYSITTFESTLIIDDKVQYFGVVSGAGFQNNTIGKNLNYTSATGGVNITTITVFVPNSINASTSFKVTLSNIKYKFASDVNEKTQDNVIETVQVVVPTTTTTTTTTTTPTTTTQPGSAKTFTVTLDSNNGSNQTSTESCSTTGNSCKINLTNVTVPTKTSFTFAGWGNKATCTEGNKTSYTADKNTTLYACWVSGGGTTSTTTTTKAGDTTSTTTPNSGNTVSLYLKTLSIEGQTLEFSKFITDYELTVLYEVESLKITAEAATEGVTVEVGDSTLELGENTIVIKLIDTSGTTNSYVLKVKRLNEGEIIKPLSSDATLKSVSFGNYAVNFSPTVNNYELVIDSKIDTLPVSAITNDENAIYVVEGNFDLQTGSVVKLIVKAEDGVTLNTYNFTITVKGSITDYILYIAIGGVLLIALIALVIYQSKSKKPTTKVAPKAPVKKTNAAPKTAPKPPSKPVTTKNEVEVLDI